MSPSCVDCRIIHLRLRLAEAIYTARRERGY